ncbi:MAG: AMP-binding protein [Muribaculaceae bacterium]|nr:AMP-binding protein [Muribaculaceae bacterium]
MNKHHNSEYGALVPIIQSAVRKNWDRMCLSDIGGTNYRYRDLAQVVEKLHIIFESAGVKRGDKVAICGRNSSNWAVVFLACLTSGVVAVPILHEFKPDTIHHLVNHSDAKLLFVDAAIWENLDENLLPNLVGAIYIAEFGMPLSRSNKLTDTRNNLNEVFGKKYPYDFTPDDVNWPEDKPEDLAVINYTSGSTGMSKGVMLPYRAIWSNIRFCIDNLDFLRPGDGIVNMLPLAHLYGMVIEMLHPLVKGCHCNFLTKVPSPKIILSAFAEVRPKLIITVPLILEKIIKKKVFPELEKPMMKFLLKLPVVDDKVLAKVRASLIEAFGGEVREIIIGGAALNAEVAQFLDRINFPYTVGYGMTECGPLISYCPPENQKPGSVGKIVERMECRVESPDPVNVPGDLWVRGANVMDGYYKNEKATDEVMSKDGWMNTGDLCRIDEDGYIYISGRSKTMILGPSGQNIYPEEIEQKLNNMPYVAESLVIDEGGKLVALIVPDFEALGKEAHDREAIEKIMDENIKNLNPELPDYSRISRFKIFQEEFEKTPKRSIKRFLYQP